MSPFIATIILTGAVLSTSGVFYLTRDAISDKSTDVSTTIANGSGGGGGGSGGGGSSDTTASTPVFSSVSNVDASRNANFSFPLTVSLPDNDGSESYRLEISGLPNDVIYSAGSFSGGTLSLTSGQYGSLVLQTATNGAYNLSVTAISTESNGGAEANASASFTLNVTTPVSFTAGADTVDLTTASGTYTAGVLQNSMDGDDDVTLPNSTKATELNFTGLTFDGGDGTDACRVTSADVWTLANCERVFGNGLTNSVILSPNGGIYTVSEIDNIENIAMSNSDDGLRLYTGAFNQPNMNINLGGGSGDYIDLNTSSATYSMGGIDNTEYLYLRQGQNLTFNGPVNGNNLMIDLKNFNVLNFNSPVNTINGFIVATSSFNLARFFLSDSDDTFTIRKNGQNFYFDDQMTLFTKGGTDTINLTNAFNQMVVDAEVINVNYAFTPNAGAAGIRIGKGTSYTSHPVITKTGSAPDFYVSYDCGQSNIACAGGSQISGIQPNYFNGVTTIIVSSAFDLQFNEGTYGEFINNGGSVRFSDANSNGTTNMTVTNLFSGSYEFGNDYGVGLTTTNDNLTITGAYRLASTTTTVNFYGGNDTVNVSGTDLNTFIFTANDGNKTFTFNNTGSFGSTRIEQNVSSANVTVVYSTAPADGMMFQYNFNFANDKIKVSDFVGTPTTSNVRIRGYNAGSVGNTITNSNHVQLEAFSGGSWKRVTVFGNSGSTNALRTPDGRFSGAGGAVSDTDADATVADLIANGQIY